MRKLLLLITTVLLFHFVGAQEVYKGLHWTNEGNTSYHHFVRTGGGAAVYINQVATGNIPILRLSSGVSNANGNVRFSVENNGWLGIGTTKVTENLVLHNTTSSRVVSQYSNINTDVGTLNGFIVGIESAGNGIIWNREDNFIRFGTNAMERMRLSADGKLGIGIVNPFNKLHIENGDLRIANDTGTGGDGKASIIFSEISTSNWAQARITYHGDDKAGPENYLGFGLGDNVSKNDNQMVIKRSGNVGIGTATPEYKLEVYGTIRAKEIKVEADWADFVFKHDYQLRSLTEVEDFINENGHLPDIPNEIEVKEEGISLGEMNSKLLQKIEELTLYAIQLQKDNNKMLKKQNQQEQLLAAQKNKINAQKSKISSIENFEQRLIILEKNLIQK